MKAIIHKSYVSTWMQASAYAYTRVCVCVCVCACACVCVCVLENGIVLQIIYVAMSFD